MQPRKKLWKSPVVAVTDDEVAVDAVNEELRAAKAKKKQVSIKTPKHDTARSSSSSLSARQKTPHPLHRMQMKNQPEEPGLPKTPSEFFDMLKDSLLKKSSEDESDDKEEVDDDSVNIFAKICQVRTENCCGSNRNISVGERSFKNLGW